MLDAIHACFLEYFLRRELFLGRKTGEDADGVWTLSRGDRMRACWLKAPLRREDAPRRIADLLDRCRAREPGSSWILAVESEDLGPLWVERGFRISEMEHGLARPLEGLEAGALPDGVSVAPVDDEAGLARCAGVVALGRTEGWAGLFKAAHPRLDSLPGARLFLASSGGEPAACALLFRSGGVASIWWVTTAPAFRNRGIGSAVTRHALAEARKEGDSLAAMAAMASAKGMYERMGFREAFGFRAYRWGV